MRSQTAAAVTGGTSSFSPDTVQAKRSGGAAADGPETVMIAPIRAAAVIARAMAGSLAVRDDAAMNMEERVRVHTTRPALMHLFQVARPGDLSEENEVGRAER